MGNTPWSGSNSVLDGRHGLGDKLRQVAAAHRRLVHDPVVARLLWQPEGSPAHIIGADRRPLRHLAGGLVFLDLSRGRLEPVCRMPEEDDSEHRHEVVTGGELGVGAEIIRRFPQVRLEFFDVFQAVECHLLSAVSGSEKGYAS